MEASIDAIVGHCCMVGRGAVKRAYPAPSAPAAGRAGVKDITSTPRGPSGGVIEPAR
jgi:hypothetical protein